MELPDELKIRAILTQGGAFKAKLPTDSYPRYYFILNRNPETDKELVLLSSTTQFDEHRNCKGGDDVHVPLSKRDYSDFTQDCLVCCDRPKCRPKKMLEQILKSQKWQLLAPLPKEILTRMIRGIARSNVVTPREKEMVIGKDV
jgi:hypothetical protein